MERYLPLPSERKQNGPSAASPVGTQMGGGGGGGGEGEGGGGDGRGGDGGLVEARSRGDGTIGPPPCIE
eukprot:7377115-Prymnesium_polylepis.1